MAPQSLVTKYKRITRLIPISIFLTITVSFGQFWAGVAIYSFLGINEYQSTTNSDQFWNILGKYFLVLLLQQVLFLFGFSGMVMFNNLLFESALTLKVFLLQMVNDDMCTRDELAEIKQILLLDPVHNDKFLILVERKLLAKSFSQT
jgi:hypothetical protein